MNSGEGKGLKTDITDYAVFFVSGDDKVRCDVIHYYTTDDQIICETSEFPHDGDFFVKVFANGREIGENGYGKTCKTCRIRAYSNYNPVIKSISPSNVAKNGDIIQISGRIFTDAYEEDRCVLGDDFEECDQSDRVEEGSNYLLGQPKFMDRLGRVVGTCEMTENLGPGPNVKLTNYNDGFIRCRIQSNFIGNVNVTFSTRFNGESSSFDSLYSVVGEENDLVNFQIIPIVDDVVNGGGSIMGGNTVIVRGGPFLDDETRVDVDGQAAEILSMTESDLTFAAPAAPTGGAECGGFGERGFSVKVWDTAQSNIWEPLFTDPVVSDATEAKFERTGKWTAHLEGYFVAPSDGYYSFLVSANQEGRLFFSTTGCKSDARLVTDVRNSRNDIDFFGESRRAVMDKAFLASGKGYYIRAEGYSLSAWDDGFLSIGVLYHSAAGADQSAMSYQYETQVISITDQEQDEIQDITFDTPVDGDTKFTLVVDGTQTDELSGGLTGDEISEALNGLSASTCKDRGVVSAAFRNGMENDEVWPRERYVRSVEPFCGSRTFHLDSKRNKLTVYDSKRYSQSCKNGN